MPPPGPQRDKSSITVASLIRREHRGVPAGQTHPRAHRGAQHEPARRLSPALRRIHGERNVCTRRNRDAVHAVRDGCASAELSRETDPVPRRFYRRRQRGWHRLAASRRASAKRWAPRSSLGTAGSRRQHRGADRRARPADGYTLLWSSPGALTISQIHREEPALQRRDRVCPDRVRGDLLQCAWSCATTPQLTSVEQLVALAKEAGQLRYATQGSGLGRAPVRRNAAGDDRSGLDTCAV